jgi:hypothetical protein
MGTQMSFWGIPLSSQLGNVAVDVAFDYIDEADEMEGTLPVIKVRARPSLSQADRTLHCAV